MQVVSEIVLYDIGKPTQFGFIVREQNEIVTIPQIAFDPAGLLHQNIQLVQVKIAQPLRNEITNGDTPPRRHTLTCTGTVYNLIKKRQCLPTLYLLA